MVPRASFQILFCSLLLLGTCNTARILGVFYLPSPSHHIITGALMRELAARGHQVVAITPYSTGEQLGNYTEFEIEDLPDIQGGGSGNFFDDNESVFTKVKQMQRIVRQCCENTLGSKALTNLLKSNAKFDVLFVSPIMCEALFGIAHHYDVPIITFMPQGSNVVMDHVFGNSGPYAYVAHPILPINFPMSFLDRVKNTVINVVVDILMNWYALYAQDELVQKHFPGAPPLDEIMNRIQLGFFASHPAIETPRPHMPNMIQIGGLQMESPEVVPDDLQKLLDDAKHGVIYFNFGSNIKSSTLPKSTIKNLLDVFKEREELILWKFEEEFEGLPKNVVIRKWISQRGVLAHPNVKVFITHGGLGGVTESVYNGVPMICIPIFADQFNNCHGSDVRGYAKLIEFSKLTKETLSDALDEVVNNPKYRANISARSDLFRSQPTSSMDKAIFWIEYIVKHKGAPHLQSPAKHLNWFQLMLLDVIGFIALVLLIAFGLIYWLLGMVWRLVKKCCKKGDCKKKNKKD